MGFFNQPTPTCAKEDQGNCYIYVYSGGSLMGRPLRAPSPIFSEAKKGTFYSGAIGHVLLCFLNSQKLANGDQENYWGYMLHSGFSLTQILVLGEHPHFFAGGKTLNFRQNFRQHLELAAYYSKTRRNMGNLKQ